MKAVVNRTVLGQGIARVEGVSKVTGTCTYAADVNRPEALWGGFLRSPFPHARILDIDVSRAQRLPGVKAVITGKDASPRLEGLLEADGSLRLPMTGGLWPRGESI